MNSTKQTVNLKASGQTLREISRNIPSVRFALLELIKNAYEAGSKVVSVELKDETLIISDDGSGMNYEDIKTLLTIANSKKRFGSTVNNRLISGQKGVGFFSSFKFGRKVRVETIQNYVKYTLFMDYDEILRCGDISEYKVSAATADTSDSNGTFITISELDVNQLQLLKETLENGSWYEKIKHTIIDKDFEINLKGWNYSKKEYQDMEPYKIAQVKFKTSEVKGDKSSLSIFSENGNGVINIPEKFYGLIENQSISIDIDIKLYNFKKTSPKFSVKKSNPLFLNDKMNKISPLIYINNALFDNYQMYNVEANTSKKSSDVIRQQTGYIKLNFYSNDIIDFNSDRTRINESLFQKNLKEFLDFISSDVQTFIKKNERQNPNNLQNLCFFESQKIDIGLNDCNEYKYNGSKVDKFDKSMFGQWDIKLKNGGVINFELKKDLTPSIKLLSTKLEICKKYKYSEIFDMYNSFNEKGEDIAIKVNTFGRDSDILVSKDHLQFQKSGKNKISVVITDKNTKKRNEEWFDLDVVNYEGKKSEMKCSDTNFIRSIQEFKHSNINADIEKFRNEINCAKNSGKFEMLLISGCRTFVELLVNDIAKKMKLDHNTDELSTKYNSVINHIISKYEGEISNETEKSRIRNTIKKITKGLDHQGLIDSLNLTSHWGVRIITIDILMGRHLNVINLLFTYLQFITQ